MGLVCLSATFVAYGYLLFFECFALVAFMEMIIWISFATSHLGLAFHDYVLQSFGLCDICSSFIL